MIDHAPELCFAIEPLNVVRCRGICTVLLMDAMSKFALQIRNLRLDMIPAEGADARSILLLLPLVSDALPGVLLQALALILNAGDNLVDGAGLPVNNFAVATCTHIAHFKHGLTIRPALVAAVGQMRGVARLTIQYYVRLKRPG